MPWGIKNTRSTANSAKTVRNEKSPAVTVVANVNKAKNMNIEPKSAAKLKGKIVKRKINFDQQDEKASPKVN